MSRKFIPRPYQRYAIGQILEKPYIALMLDMGLGKTVTTLTAIKLLMYSYFSVSRVLVIAPLRVADVTWSAECMEWEHLNDLRCSKVLGTEKKRLEALEADADIYIVNRENVPWLVKHYKREWPFDMVVIDESSSFKNHAAQRFKALRKVRPKISRLVELTGTPTPNGLMDLWSQIYLLDMGKRLGETITSYRARYFKPGYGNGYVTYYWEPLTGADKEIYQRISDICVSMKSEDYITLPDMIYNRVPVRLPETAYERYKELERQNVCELEENQVAAFSAAAVSNKLLQLASGFAYTETEEGEALTLDLHTEKLKALQDIAEAEEHKSLLVFYWFKADLVRLKKTFKHARELKTADDVSDWNAGKIPLLLAHPAAAGHGLNLQFGGSVIVWYGLTWSLELYQQANKRLHRSGQAHTVIIHHLIAEGTIDEDVMTALEGKKQGQDAMLEAIKARIRMYGG